MEKPITYETFMEADCFELDSTEQTGDRLPVNPKCKHEARNISGTLDKGENRIE
jgi:hypothetical protein